MPGDSPVALFTSDEASLEPWNCRPSKPRAEGELDSISAGGTPGEEIRVDAHLCRLRHIMGLAPGR